MDLTMVTFATGGPALVCTQLAVLSPLYEMISMELRASGGQFHNGPHHEGPTIKISW
jgi:hypothetical protein